MSSAQPDLRFARHRDFLPCWPIGLVLVDCQRLFLDRASPACLPGAQGVVDQAAALLAHFGRVGLPIALTRHAHRRRPSGGGPGSWWTRFLMEGEPLADLVPGLQVPASSLLVRKDHYSAFRCTQLYPWLRRHRVRGLVVAGVMTHICVDTTARDAFMRGFDVLIASDACTATHPRLHAAALLTLSHAVARVLPTAEVLRAMEARS